MIAGIGWFAREGGAGGYVTPGYSPGRSVQVVYEVRILKSKTLHTNCCNGQIFSYKTIRSWQGTESMCDSSQAERSKIGTQ